MSVVKVVEVIASSEKSFDDAVVKAHKKASETVGNIKSGCVKNMKAKVENNQVPEYGVNAEVSFEIKENNF